MNEQLEYLRLKVIDLEDRPNTLEQLAMEHFPKLMDLCKQIAEVRPEENRTTILLEHVERDVLVGLSETDSRRRYMRTKFMVFLDLVCRIRQLTNQDKVRQLIDQYEGGWDATR